MKKILLLLFLSIQIVALAQLSISIPQIQGNGNISTYTQQRVVTSGVVTAVYTGKGTIGGFFLQDKIGDNNPETSDGIFVYAPSTTVHVGDEVRFESTVEEHYGRTQLSSISGLKIVSQNNPLPITHVTYDMYRWDWERYEGMVVTFKETLFVNSTQRLEKYGEIELGTKRKMIPTHLYLPKTTNYYALVDENALPPIYLDDAMTEQYVKPIRLANEDGVRRTGERVDNLSVVVDYNYGKYTFYPLRFPVPFYGNTRSSTHNDIGNYNLKICSFNLEYYLTKYLGTGFGPDNSTQSEQQHRKIIAALEAIDADIYGFVEIEQGQTALGKLANTLNALSGDRRYSFVDDGGDIKGSYTKVGYLYRNDKVTPYKSLRNNNSPYPPHRKKVQAFTLNENGERFVFSLNHFKSKGGCQRAKGLDQDQDDGQACYNAKRVQEAKSTLNFINNHRTYYDDTDILVMGDLNAYAKEDPIQVFTNKGYIDLLNKYGSDSIYSYVYKGEAGYLDHALASTNLAGQVTGATVFHINADELPSFGYDGQHYRPDMYRSSDHDPVIVGLRLGDISSLSVSDRLEVEERVKIYPTMVADILHITNAKDSYVEFYTLNGILLHRIEVQSDEMEISTSQLEMQTGTYVLRVLGANQIKRQIIFVK